MGINSQMRPFDAMRNNNHDRRGDESVPRGTLGFKHGRGVGEGSSEERRGVNQGTQPKRVRGAFEEKGIQGW